MLQTCQKCGHESPTGDKFCRQCGGPFVAESEASAAATRNYIKQETPPSVAPGGSGYFPPSVADAIVGDTERYYQPPQLPQIQYTSQLGSKFGRWRWTLWVMALILTALFSSLAAYRAANSPGRMQRGPAQPIRSQAEEEARGREERNRREARDKVREARERSEEAERRVKHAVQQFRESRERAMEAGANVPNSGETPLDLSQYHYSNASSSTASRIPGYEMLSIRTSDNIDTIKQFYERKIGSPVIEVNDQIQKWILFQTEKAPSIVVFVDSELPDQRRIIVLRYPFRFLPIVDSPEGVGPQTRK